VASPPTNVRWGILIPHHIGLCFVNITSHVDAYVAAIGGNTWFINRVDQHVMGNFNSRLLSHMYVGRFTHSLSAQSWKATGAARYWATLRQRRQVQHTYCDCSRQCRSTSIVCEFGWRILWLWTDSVRLKAPLWDCWVVHFRQWVFVCLSTRFQCVHMSLVNWGSCVVPSSRQCLQCHSDALAFH
jgi:hypothetical protein